jgi:hypothetical protein
MGAVAVHGDDLTLDAARKGTCAGSLVKNGKAMMAPALEPPTSCQRRPWSRETADAFPLAPRTAGVRTARRRRPAGCRQPKVGPSEEKSRAPGVVDSERLSPGRDRRWHPRQVQRCRSCLRERKITLPTDLRGRGIAMERAAAFRGGQLGARNPRRLERTGYDHAKSHEAHADDEIPHHSRLLFSFVRRVPPLVRHVPGPVQTSFVHGVASPMIRAGGLDSAPPICTLARFEVRASWASRSTPSHPQPTQRCG